jgi:hypothetical protein
VDRSSREPQVIAVCAAESSHAANTSAGLAGIRPDSPIDSVAMQELARSRMRAHFDRLLYTGRSGS